MVSCTSARARPLQVDGKPVQALCFVYSICSIFPYLFIKQQKVDFLGYVARAHLDINATIFSQCFEQRDTYSTSILLKLLEKLKGGGQRHSRLLQIVIIRNLFYVSVTHEGDKTVKPDYNVRCMLSVHTLIRTSLRTLLAPATK